jgi:hypothetical protein
MAKPTAMPNRVSIRDFDGFCIGRVVDSGGKWSNLWCAGEGDSLSMTEVEQRKGELTCFLARTPLASTTRAG